MTASDLNVKQRLILGLTGFMGLVIPLQSSPANSQERNEEIREIMGAIRDSCEYDKIPVGTLSTIREEFYEAVAQSEHVFDLALPFREFTHGRRCFLWNEEECDWKTPEANLGRIRPQGRYLMVLVKPNHKYKFGAMERLQLDEFAGVNDLQALA